MAELDDELKHKRALKDVGNEYEVGIVRLEAYIKVELIASQFRKMQKKLSKQESF